MKLVYSLITIVSWGFSMQAVAASECLEKVVTRYSISEPSTDQYRCILSNDRFVSGAKALCAGKNSLTNEYKKYLDYEDQYNVKLKALRAAPSEAERSVLSMDLLMIEREWMLFGFRFEIESLHLHDVQSGISSCLHR